MSLGLLLGVALIGVSFVVLAVVRPRVSLLVLVALDISNINGVIADQAGISPYRPQLALAIVVLLIMVRRRMFRISWSPVLLGLLILVAGFCLTFVSADDPVTSQALLFERSRDVLYFVVVFALVLSTDSLKQVVQSAVLVLAVLAALTAVHQFVLHNNGDLFGLSQVPLVQEGGAATARHAGTSSDVNFWARLLILVAPLSLSLWASARRWPGRIFWAGCAGCLAVGVFLTQSRGGFIALFVAVLVWLFLAGGRYRRSLLLVPVVLAILVPASGIGSRLGTLSAITAGSTANADPSVVTRKRLQLDALQMFVDRPITGHGIGSYGRIFPRYDRLSDYYQPVDIVVAAHNFYLEQAADGGVMLLLAWAIFLGSILFTAARARTLAVRAGDQTVRFLALGVIGGVVGWLVASVFLHLSDFRALLLLAAVAAAADVHLRAAVALKESTPAAVPAVAAAPVGRIAEWGLAAAGVLSAIGLVAALTTGSAQYRSVTTLAVAPAARAVDPSAAYQLDVVSRGLIVPTLASVLDAAITPTVLERESGQPATGSLAIDVAQSRLGGAVVMTVSATDQQAAIDAGIAAVALAKTQVADLRSRYQLLGTAAVPQPQWPARRWLSLPLALILFASAMALWRSFRERATRPEPSGKRYLSADTLERSP